MAEDELTDQQAFLDSVIEQLGRYCPAGPSAVVFDLDGTLLDNRPRTCAILRERARVLADTSRDIARKLALMRPDELVYDLRDNLKQRGISDLDEVGDI